MLFIILLASSFGLFAICTVWEDLCKDVLIKDNLLALKYCCGISLFLSFLFFCFVWDNAANHIAMRGKKDCIATIYVPCGTRLEANILAGKIGLNGLIWRYIDNKAKDI